MPPCTECHELGRSYVVARNEERNLEARLRGRHASRAERRRLVRLRADHYIAKQLYQNHKSTCEETEQ
jgi:hypothetical protein